jgi:hypothetical protein
LYSFTGLYSSSTLELRDPILQPLDHVPLGVRQLEDGLVAGVGVGDDVAGDTDNGGVGGYVGHHDRASADLGVIADVDGADDLGAGADDDAVAQRGMALGPLGAGAA